MNKTLCPEVDHSSIMSVLNPEVEKQQFAHTGKSELLYYFVQLVCATGIECNMLKNMCTVGSMYV